MKTWTTALFVSACLALAGMPWIPGASSAGVGGRILALDLGTPEGPGALQVAGFPSCATASSGITCYDLVGPAAFSSMSFGVYTVLYVGWTEGASADAINALYARSADISTFVLGGGGLVAYAEYNPGQWTWIPDGGVMSYVGEHADDVVPTAAGATHPTYAGQNPATASNWLSSRHNYFTSWPSYLIPLATDIGGTKTVSLAGEFGEGCVFVTGQDPDWHAHAQGQPAAIKMVSDTVNWGSGCGITPPIPVAGAVLVLDLGTPEGPGSLEKAGVMPCASAPSPSVLCYDLVSPAAFHSILLAPYSVLFVGWTYTGYGNDAAAMSALGARSADIDAWVATGGAVVALAEFDPTGIPTHWAWVPGGVLPPIGYVAEHADDVKLPAAPHPAYAGQTSATVSGWENARHNYFTSWPSYLSAIATDGSGSKVVSLAGTYGSGCVFLTGQDPDWHSYHADQVHATLMIRHVMSWAAQC